MIAPENPEKLTDAQLLIELKKLYPDDAAKYLLEVIRGRESVPEGFDIL